MAVKESKIADDEYIFHVQDFLCWLVANNCKIQNGMVYLVRDDFPPNSYLFCIGPF